MIIYISELIVVLLLVAFSIKDRIYITNKFGEKYIKPNYIIFILAAIIILTVYAFRYKTGTDTPVYIKGYYANKYISFSEIIEGTDIFFYLLRWCIYKISGGNLIINNYILGIITYVPVLVFFIKYSNNITGAITFYFLSGSYYFGFNGQRQAVAMGIITIGIMELIRHHKLNYIIICLVAYMFHSTALMILPIGLLCSLETTDKKFYIITIAGALLAIVAGSLWDRLFEILGMMGQDRLVNQYADNGMETFQGVNILRVLVTVTPVLIYVVFRKRFDRNSISDSIICNFSIWGAIFMVAGATSWLFARLTAYAFAPQAILISRIPNMFESKSKKICLIIMVCLYLIYWYTYIHMDSSLLPYRLSDYTKFY